MLSKRKRRALRSNWRVYRLRGVRATLREISTHDDLSIRTQRRCKKLMEGVEEILNTLKRRQK